MPAPAMSSRHLYTGHRRGHIQAAPRLRAHRGEPLSRDHPQIPVSMPSLFRFDASAVVHTCSSSHRTPAPLTARRQPQRSPPRLLTDAACGGLGSPPARRPRRTYLHHWHSTDRADDLLHHHHFPSGTHVGAGNSAVVVDLPRWGPMLSPRVPNLVPIPGPRMERETPGQRPRPNYGHPQPLAELHPLRTVEGRRSAMRSGGEASGGCSGRATTLCRCWHSYVTLGRVHRVGAENCVVAGQAAFRYSLMSPPQRAVLTTWRCPPGWSAASVATGGSWSSERWGRCVL